MDSDLKLKCVVDAKPLPAADAYRWWHERIPLRETSNTLYIRNLDPTKHNGAYKCAAQNKYGFSNKAYYGLSVTCKLSVNLLK